MDRCEELTQYLVAYADGELEGKLLERVRAHLEGCERCRSEYAQLTKVGELFRRAVPEEVPRGDWAKVSAAIEKAMAESASESVRARPERKRFFGWWLVPAAGLAAAVVVVALVIGLGGAPPGSVMGLVDGVQVGADYDVIVRTAEGDDQILVIDVVGMD